MTTPSFQLDRNFLTLAVIVALVLAAGRLGADTYTVTDLGTLGGTQSFAYAINASGTVVGEAETATGKFHATRFTGTGSGNVDLGTLGGSASAANAINASGQIVGDASPVGDSARHATLFSGTGVWKFKAKLKLGKNVVTVIAHGPGGDSVPAKLKVTRN